jgi:GDP-L-fucose synthase
MELYAGKKILVTGGTGMIGRALVAALLRAGGDVHIASLDDPSRALPGTTFHRLDLMSLENCLQVCAGMDFIFHLAGIKGSPAMTAKKPASFFVPTLAFNTNMMEAARRCGVKRFLYTSTIGVYQPAEILREDDVWKTFPSENDRFAGWAKRMGELQAEAYRIEYGWDTIAIVRPANVYGPYDNFDPRNAMVIPSLIRRALSGENPLVVWGDGTAIRDFIHCDDVAAGMLAVIASGTHEPVNLGSGTGVTIRQVVDVLVKLLDPAPKIEWDITKPTGDRKRLMDTSRARALGFAPRISLEEGIRGTLEWYRANAAEADKRYNVFVDPPSGKA